VSTDCEDIEETALANKVSVHRREAYTATSTASSLVAVQEFLFSHPSEHILEALNIFKEFDSQILYEKWVVFEDCLNSLIK